jgi:hypothetical protein
MPAATAIRADEGFHSMDVDEVLTVTCPTVLNDIEHAQPRLAVGWNSLTPDIPPTGSVHARANGLVDGQTIAA